MRGGAFFFVFLVVAASASTASGVGVSPRAFATNPAQGVDGVVSSRRSLARWASRAGPPNARAGVAGESRLANPNFVADPGDARADALELEY